MKAFKYIIMSIICSMGLWACSDNWDSHFSKEEVVIDNIEILSVDKSATEFLREAPEYQLMYKLFEETNVVSKWEEKDLLYTIMVVKDDKATHSSKTRSGEIDAEDLFLAQAHITDALLSPSNLVDGQRLLMWNNKYVNVTKTTETSVEGVEPGTYFNGAKVKSVIKTTNAYIYELDEYIHTPKSLMEFLEELPDDEYSIFKKMVFDRTERVFDKAASTPIGIDQSGNTIYDSVFTVRSKYFSDKNLDLYSENISATLLLPTNSQITEALADAKARLKAWDIERPDSTLNNWIFQVAFFNKKYTKEDLTYTESDPNSVQDFQSIFDQQWRTTVNKLDLDNPIELSNAIAYKVTSLKIPGNKILIWRFKERFETLDYLTEEEIKRLYYKDYVYIKATEKIFGPNLKLNRVKQYVGANQPKPHLPAIYCKSMMLYLVDKQQPGIFTFKLYKLVEDPTSSTGFRPELYKIPAGEYNFRMGGVGNRSNVDATFYINGKVIPKCEEGPIPASTMKGSNHDRSGGGYSELPGAQVSNYDRDGSTDLGNVVFEEDCDEVEVKVVFTAGGTSTYEPTLWCLRPTANFY